MRKTVFVMASVVALTLLTAAGASATCSPDGYCPYNGCIGWFNWTSNSSFSSGASCWTLYGSASVKSDGLMCIGRPYVQFDQGFSSGLQQVVHVAGPGEPNYQSSDHFEFDYWVQFLDPHHDAWDTLTIGLYDNNSGALLQWVTTVTGAQTDPNCANTYLDFHNSGLIGKNVRIDVQARNLYSDTKIRVTGLALWQKP